MTASLPQVRYNREDVRRMLVEYQQRFALGARPPRREERIGSQRQRLDDAPWVMTAAAEADLELALKSAPTRWVLIAFMDLAIGASDWRISTQAKGKDGRLLNQSWREKVGDWWGLTAGEVATVTAEVIEIVYARLNGHDLPPSWGH